MKNYFWLIFTLLILTSCQFKEKKEEKNYPFTNLKISAIKIDDENNLENQDSVLIKEILDFLKKLNSANLIKGKRLHGAEKLCNMIIKNRNDNEILISISTHKEKGTTADFFQEKKSDNFTYFLGRLYNADKLVHLLQKHGMNCGGLNKTTNRKKPAGNTVYNK